MHAHGSSPDPKSRRDHGASIKSAHAVRGAVTPDPVNARALAPVGTDGSGAATWSGYKISYPIASYRIASYLVSFLVAKGISPPLVTIA